MPLLKLKRELLNIGRVRIINNKAYFIDNMSHKIED